MHVLLTCGAFTPQGEFLELPELDIQRLEAAWQEAVFALYLSEGKIEPEVVENMRTWPHSGFSVDQSVYLPAGDQPGIERLVRYMTRCPFSLSRLVKVTETGQVVYKAEKQSCLAFPDPQGDGLVCGPKRNFQLLDPLDFLAEFTQHIPPKGAHLIRYYGFYSKKSRGLREKAAAEQAEQGDKPSGEDDASGAAPTRCNKTWAMLIKRVYEVDPRVGPRCSSAGGGGDVHRPAARRGDRENSPSLRSVARFRTEAATRRGRCGPRVGRLLRGQPAGRTHLRGHGHLRGHLLILTDTPRHGDGAREARDRPVICGLTGQSFILLYPLSFDESLVGARRSVHVLPFVAGVAGRYRATDRRFRLVGSVLHHRDLWFPFLVGGTLTRDEFAG